MNERQANDAARAIAERLQVKLIECGLTKSNVISFDQLCLDLIVIVKAELLQRFGK